MKKSLFIVWNTFVLLFFIQSVDAQTFVQLDSLYNTYKEQKGAGLKLEVGLNLLDEMRKEEMKRYKTISDSMLLKDIFDQLDDSTQIAEVGNRWNKLGRSYRIKGKYDLAFEYYFYVTKLFSEKKHYNRLPETYNCLGVVFRRIDIFSEALEFHMKAYAIAEYLKDSMNMAIALNGIGNALFMTDQYDKAALNFKEALEIQRLRKSIRGQAINYNNLSNIAKVKGDYEVAKTLLEKSAECNLKDNNKMGLAICNRDFAEILLADTANPQYDLAENYLIKALAQHREIGDKRGETSSFLGLANLKLQQGNETSAKAYLDSTLIVARDIRALSRLFKVYELKYQLAIKQGKFEDALGFYKTSKSYKDSMLVSSTRMGIYQMLKRLKDHDNKEMVLKLESEKALFNKSNLFLILINFMVGILLILIVAYTLKRNNVLRELQTKQKDLEKVKYSLETNRNELVLAKQKAEEANKIKTRFLSEVSHEIRTPLNSILGFTRLIKESVDHEEKDLHLFLNSIQESGDKLLRLVCSILDLTNMETEENYSNSSVVYIKEAIDQIKDDLKKILREKEITMDVHQADYIPARIMMNRNFFVQFIYYVVLDLIPKLEKHIVKVSVNGEYRDDKFGLKVQIRYVGEPMRVWGKTAHYAIRDKQGFSTLLLMRLAQLTGAYVQERVLPENCQSVEIEFPFEEVEEMDRGTFKPCYSFNNLNMEKKRLMILASDFDRYEPLRKYMVNCGFIVLQLDLQAKTLLQIERFSPKGILCFVDDKISQRRELLDQLNEYCLDKNIPMVAGTKKIDAKKYANQYWLKYFDGMFPEPIEMCKVFRVFALENYGVKIESLNECVDKGMESIVWPEKILSLILQLDISNSIDLYRQLADALHDFAVKEHHTRLEAFAKEMQFNCETFDISELVLRYKKIKAVVVENNESLQSILID